MASRINNEAFQPTQLASTSAAGPWYRFCFGSQSWSFSNHSIKHTKVEFVLFFTIKIARYKNIYQSGSHFMQWFTFDEETEPPHFDTLSRDVCVINGSFYFCSFRKVLVVIAVDSQILWQGLMMKISRRLQNARKFFFQCNTLKLFNIAWPNNSNTTLLRLRKRKPQTRLFHKYWGQISMKWQKNELSYYLTVYCHTKTIHSNYVYIVSIILL